MRKAIIVGLIVLAAGGGYLLFNRSEAPAGEGGGQGGGFAGPGGGGGGFGGPGGAFARPPMTVEIAQASRDRITESLLVVGNLVGAATVEVTSKVSGRLLEVNVRLGDPVRRGQVLATVEDREISEQVKQAQASFEVAAATVRQREADLKFAETNLERSRSLFDRQLLPQQSLDDAEARAQAAAAQLDLARAQFQQAGARLEELRIMLANTRIPSPVDGFIGRRHLDPGAFATSNSAVVSVVDIHLVRLVVNLVERDLRRVNVGATAVAEVDAYPGEQFTGRVARVAPILDEATRTAQMEIELPNPTFRLKPGMYARVQLTTAERPDALVVPRNAVVDLQGARGVFLFDAANQVARFQAIESGLESDDLIEVVAGIAEGQTIITTGAAGLGDGDRVLLPGDAAQEGPRRFGAGGQRGGAAAGGQRPQQGGGRAQGDPGGIAAQERPEGATARPGRDGAGPQEGPGAPGTGLRFRGGERPGAPGGPGQATRSGAPAPDAPAGTDDGGSARTPAPSRQ
jgi:RND family efflux transporter MFP subunit